MNLIEAYRVMLAFLNAFYRKNQSDELGALLGSMSLLKDGIPADSAYAKDWYNAVSRVIGTSEDAVLSSETAYLAMVTFLRNWCEIGSDGTLSELCLNLEKLNSGNSRWLDAVNSVMNEKDEPYLNP